MGDSGDYLVSSMRMTWLCVVSRSSTVGRFVEVCRRKGMKVNTGKNMMMVLNGEEC